MAMSSQFVGEIVGYRSFVDKEGVVNHTYLCLVKQRVDSETKLPTECAVCEVREREQVLGVDLKAGTKVRFWQEERTGKNGKFYMYTGLEKV